MTPHSDLFPLITFIAQDGASTGVPANVPDIPARDQPVAGNEGSASTEASGSSNGTLDPNGSGATGGPPPSMFNSPIMLVLFGFLIFMFITTIFSGKKQKKQREQMLSSLNKHDRIMTSSGMMGTIVEIKDSELVLRIDDATGAKAHFARDAVARVVKPSATQSSTD